MPGIHARLGHYISKTISRQTAVHININQGNDNKIIKNY